MTRVLVTGAAGTLGRQLLGRLSATGAWQVRGSGRRARPADLPPGVEWVQTDLTAGPRCLRGPLAPELTAGVDVIIHAATSPLRNTEQVDVEGTRRLLAAAHASGVRHFVYVSCVGANRVPLVYYRHKVRAEVIVAVSGLPWTILRTTEFHDLLDGALRGAARLPLVLLPARFRFQPVDASEVADALCACVAAGPRGRVPDMGGPAVQDMVELARQWFGARGLHRPVVPMPVPGQLAGAFREGYNTSPQHRAGHVTWAEWLVQNYRMRRPAAS